MSLVPHRFLVRVAHPCLYLKDVPREDDDRLLDLPEACRLDNFAAMDGRKNFADVRLAWNEFGVDDYVLIGQEVIRLQELPRGPDDDTRFYAVGGARVSYLGTSPQTHALGSPVYRVTVHPPGTNFAPNGLPVVPLYHRTNWIWRASRAAVRNMNAGAFIGAPAPGGLPTSGRKLT